VSDRDPESDGAVAYPPIGDYAIIGDCHSAALVSREAAIEWCCLPRFDSGSAFAAMLDRKRGGVCSVTPVDDAHWRYSRRYLGDTLLLETTVQGPSGEVAVLDLFVAGRERANVDRRILRVVEGRRGAVELRVRVAPRFDYGQVRPWVRRLGLKTYSAVGGNDALVVWCEHELTEDPGHELTGTVTVNAGDRVHLLLGYWRPELIDSAGTDVEPDVHALDADIERTAQWWREWAATVRLEGRDEASTRRSALTLKALTHIPTGAIVAAPTTSLPEVIGGVRNWDYRYAWVRDSSFSSRAFAAVGCVHEADAFRNFMIRSAAGHAGDLRVLYGVGGERRLDSSEVDGLVGYRGSSPVHKGNQASAQTQLDAYGEIVNLMWRWHRRGHSPDDDDWRFVCSLIDHAAEHCTDPDSGIWEWPGEPDHFVHSKVLCWSALDRGVRLADECMRRAPTRRWKRTRDELHEEIETRGFDRDRCTYTQAYDRPELDAALLLLPTVEYVDWRDPRMLGTVDAVREELAAGDGLLYRYRRDDGMPGREGAFLCCSFWLVECLARAGRLPDARAVFDRSLACANDLGLFSEEFDPASGELLGNFPQGLTHLAHIDAAVALSECEAAL
jgi:GH15 family glucan-1,4-alpha-glucosidase